jgi:hypothetical protein
LPRPFTFRFLMEAPRVEVGLCVPITHTELHLDHVAPILGQIGALGPAPNNTPPAEAVVELLRAIEQALTSGRVDLALGLVRAGLQKG